MQSLIRLYLLLRVREGDMDKIIKKDPRRNVLPKWKDSDSIRELAEEIFETMCEGKHYTPKSYIPTLSLERARNLLAHEGLVRGRLTISMTIELTEQGKRHYKLHGKRIYPK